MWEFVSRSFDQLKEFFDHHILQLSILGCVDLGGNCTSLNIKIKFRELYFGMMGNSDNFISEYS